jgi:hypothetical protein
MDGNKVSPVPAGLSGRGAAFWASTVAAYELSESELLLLLEVGRTLCDLDLLEAQVLRAGVTVPGSAGQPVLNACLTEARGMRLTLHRLLAALQLPDEDGKQVPSSGTLRGRAAAAARWNGHVADPARRGGR